MQREAKHGWINTGEINLHYLDWPGVEPALLCIHGLTGNAHCWAMLADRMQTGQRIVAVDIRGRGQSDNPPAGWYGHTRHAKDMKILLKALGIDSVVAVGWSMGANIASILAADDPELVNSLVLVDGGGIPQAFINPEGLNMIKSTVDRIDKVYPSMNAFLSFMRKNTPFIPWTEYFELVLYAEVEERTDGSVVSRSSAAGVHEDLNEIINWNPEAIMPRIRVPTLLLWAPIGLANGAKPLFTREDLERVKNLLPNGRFVTVKGANHSSIGFSTKCVDQIANVLKEFLQL